MSTWTDRVRSHPVWQQLQLLGPAVDQALGREGSDPSVSEGLVRLKAVLAFIGRRLATADSLLVQTGPLDNINTYVQSATNEIQAFNSTGNPANVANANSQADAALASLAQLNVPLATDDLVGLRESADAYHDALDGNLRGVEESASRLQSEMGSVREKLSELTAEVSAEKQRLSALASDQQGQFSTAQDTRSKEYLDAQSARQDRFAAMIADYIEKLNTQNEEFNKQRAELLQAQTKDLSGLTVDYRDQAAKILEDINNHRLQVEKLVSVIGNLGVTSGYQTTANEARTTARVWQGIALCALGAIIVVAIRAFLPLVRGTFTWESFAGRVFVSLTVGVLAAYAISQADKYQQVERRSRKLALELEAIGPYIASLPQDKQEEFRLRIGDRTFGTTDDLVDRHSSESPKSVIDVALKSKDLRTLIIEIIKAVRVG